MLPHLFIPCVPMTVYPTEHLEGGYCEDALDLFHSATALAEQGIGLDDTLAFFDLGVLEQIITVDDYQTTLITAITKKQDLLGSCSTFDFTRGTIELSLGDFDCAKLPTDLYTERAQFQAICYQMLYYFDMVSILSPHEQSYYYFEQVNDDFDDAQKTLIGQATCFSMLPNSIQATLKTYDAFVFDDDRDSFLSDLQFHLDCESQIQAYPKWYNQSLSLEQGLAQLTAFTPQDKTVKQAKASFMQIMSELTLSQAQLTSTIARIEADCPLSYLTPCYSEVFDNGIIHAMLNDHHNYVMELNLPSVTFTFTQTPDEIVGYQNLITLFALRDHFIRHID